MTEEQKKRLTELKVKNQSFSRKKELENMILLQECLASVKDYRFIEIETEEYKNILAKANTADFTRKARFCEIISPCTYYVVWDNGRAPIIECSGGKIITYWDDICCISPYLALVNKEDDTALYFDCYDY